MMEIVSFVVNLCVAALLMAFIVYSRRLNAQIRIVQDSKGEMAKMFAEFDVSIAKAAESVGELREATKKTDAILKEKLRSANMLADDLTFMIERGNKMADQLSGVKPSNSASVSPLKKPEPPRKEATEHVPQPPVNAPRPRSKAEQELLDSLKAAGR